MKNLVLLLSFVLAASGACAFAPHPSVLTVKFKGQMVPVVKVVGTDPVVIADGQENQLHAEPLYLVQRTDRFGEGFVQVRRTSLGGLETKSVASASDAQVGPEATAEGPRRGTMYFDAAMTAKSTIPHGFVVVVVYSLAGLAEDAPADSRPMVYVHDLPTLPAGQEVAVQVTGPLVAGQANQRYFFQVFDSDGRELLTNHVDAAWEFYAIRDQVELRGVVARYIEKFHGTDRAAFPAVTPRPVFFGEVKPPTRSAAAVLSVSAEGLVTSVSVRGVDDPDSRKSIADALGGWQFLPQLKAGIPVPTTVQVPLQF